MRSDWQGAVRAPRTGVRISAAIALCLAASGIAPAQRLELTRSGGPVLGDATILVEPYAPNIVRVSLSLRRGDALAAPGYGISAQPAAAGWTTESSPRGDLLRSQSLVVRVSPARPGERQPTAEDSFVSSVPDVALDIEHADGSTLLRMTGWSMSVPNHKDGNAPILNDRSPQDPPFFRVSASFSAPDDEHDYGMGQNQEGALDHRGRVVHCWHDYDAPSGQSSCVPFLITNQGYGLVWDNPSKLTASFGFNGQNNFSSQVGQRVSFFVIAGEGRPGSPESYAAIYRGFRLLTGDVPMLPKSAYGYIQSKNRYASQAELLAVARGYRERHLPIDDLVVDFFHYVKMGDLDLDPAAWPDAAAMNRELHRMHFHTMISVWPRFLPGSRYYDTVLQHGWFQSLADGTPTNGLPYDRTGSDIDSTNPEARAWYWSIVKQNYAGKGFDAFWADETEPDLPPNGSYWSIGPGTQFFNVYPLFHTQAFYEGMRRDGKERAFILARDPYLGAQHNGTAFWSSDISPSWDVFRRQIPTGLDFVASGMPYWSTDIGGWQPLPGTHKPAHPPLLDPSDARDNVGGDEDYPELYTRWFQYGTFQPNMRSHGTRNGNEVWSFGKQAEPILARYLRLRYQLMPYLYSLGYAANQTGAPFMRALFLDFGADPKVATIGDEFLFGPALLVAPVTEQGATAREVYLPAGTEWYNFWTNERVHGGQSIRVAAPIDTIPVFVRAGSILPLGSAVESTEDAQTIEQVRIYPGADGSFTLYNDDGHTYAYERGESRITELHWNDATHKLTQTGAKTDLGRTEIVAPH